MSEKQPNWPGSVTRIFAAVLMVCCSAVAKPQDPIISNGCVSGTNYETAGYRIRSVRIHHPFSFLRKINSLRTAAGDATRPLEGAPFRYAAVRQARDELEKMAWLPSLAEQRVHISLIINSVENCTDSDLDLVYSIYSSQIAAVPTFTWESRQAEIESPQTTAGIDRPAGKLRVKPIVEYNRTEQAGAGFLAEYTLPIQAATFLDSISVGALKSGQGHEISGSVEGAQDHNGSWLARTRWSFNYQHSSSPVFDSRLVKSRSAGWISTTTQPVFGFLPLRFGTSIETGRHQASGAPVAANSTDLNTAYRSIKIFAGLVSRTRRNVLSGSWGIELGTSDRSGVDWRKHVVDVAHEFSWPLRDHRFLEIESRFTGGRLQVLGPVPVGTRFFGGNKEEFLTTDSDWQIRSNPFIRSIPANRFAGSDTGADAFAAYNLTLGYPVWNFPLIPEELSRNDEFADLLDGQVVTATSILQSDYVARDTHFKRAAEMLPDVHIAIVGVRDAVTSARTSRNLPAGDPMVAMFDLCADAVNIAERRTRAALDNKGTEQYVRVLALLPSDEDRLNGVLESCAGIQSVAQAADRLRSVATALFNEFAQIDENMAAMAAEAEMAYVKRTLDTLLYEANVFALSPVGMFDAARLSMSDGSTLNRFGIGAGLRLTLISHVSFTIGYLANLRREPNEAQGALSFSLQYRDLFN